MGTMANWPRDDAVFPLCAAVVTQFEGFRAHPYRDIVGVPTIGYGVIQYPGGAMVRMSDSPITQAQATQFLIHQLGLKSRAIAPMFQARVTAHQAAAMLSLVYNIGTGAFGRSTLLRKVNAGDSAGAADQFLVWDKGHIDGQAVAIAGLLARRQAERALFLTPDHRAA